MDVQAFSPSGPCVPVAASTASASGTLPGVAVGGNSVRVYNATAGIAFFRTTLGASTALLTDAFVGPGASECFGLPPQADTFSVILSTGTGNVYAQRGFGL